MAKFRVGDLASPTEDEVSYAGDLTFGKCYPVRLVRDDGVIGIRDDAGDTRLRPANSYTNATPVPDVEPAPTPDAVFRPTHYARLWPEPVTVINAWGLGFNLGNAVKYIARAGHKDAVRQDLEKARRYIEIELECIRRREAIEAGADKSVLVETL